MAKLNFELSEFPKGYYIFCTVATHCEKKVHVTLNIGGKKPFKADKVDSDKSLKVISQKYGQSSRSNPALTIEVEDSAALQQSMVSGLIADDRGQRVGFIYDYCIESGNRDLFNDVYVNVVGWEKKG